MGLGERKPQNNQNKRRDLSCNPPPQGWISLNIDDYSKGNPRWAKVVGVIKYHVGRILLIVIEPLGIQTSYFVKARVMWISLSTIYRLHCKNLITSRDSLNTINILRRMTTSGWEIKVLLKGHYQRWTRLIMLKLRIILDNLIGWKIG